MLPPFGIINLLLTLENATIADIARRMNRMNKLSASSEYQLARLNEIKAFDVDFKALLAETMNLTLAEIDEYYKAAAIESYGYDERIYKAKGVPFTPYEKNGWLKQTTEAAALQTKDEFKNLTGTIGFRNAQGQYLQPRDYFVRKMDEAEYQVASGALTYDRVIRNTVNEMTKSGLRSVVYPGHTDRLEVATRRAVMTGTRQLADKITIKNIMDLGAEHVQVSAHLTARTGIGIANHSGWQGKIYHLSEETKSILFENLEG